MKDFEQLLEETLKSKEAEKKMWSLINSLEHKNYFVTVQDNFDLFSDEVKVIASDNDMDADSINIKKLFDKFDDKN